jgi:DNA-binding MarR family transcriptional regulator
MRQPQDQHIGYLIQQISHLVIQRHNRKLENEGVTSSQERLLTLLLLKDGATQSELQQDLLIKPSSVTKLIDVLEHKGLVTRISDARDGRVKTIHLTEKGKQLEKRLWQIKDELEVEISSSLSNQQTDLLIQLLNEIKHNLQQNK